MAKRKLSLAYKNSLKNQKKISAKENFQFSIEKEPCTSNLKLNTKNNQFAVVVTATMSAGKSTTINAMLGYPLLPSKNEACTAKIFKIEDIDGTTQLKGRVKPINGAYSNWSTIKKNDLFAINKSDISEVEIQGDFPYIKNYQKNIQFYDTPGPNNSSDKSHYEITKDILSDANYSFTVCIMNATQFGTDEERTFLKELLEHLNRKELSTKLVFAVNRTNDFDLEKESLDKLIDRVFNYLAKDIGYKDPIIIPINSLLSLNIRSILNAQKNNSPIPFSERKQKSLYREIEYYIHFADRYIDSIFRTNAELKDIYYSKAENQERNINKNDLIFLAGKDINISKLIEVDILTGIPLLEKMLENELIKNISDSEQ